MLLIGVLLFLLVLSGMLLFKSRNTSQGDRIVNQRSHSSSRSHQSPSVGSPYRVARVIDGDTIDVTVGDGLERIRFIGIDTPETVDERKPVQCYGPEASAKMKELLTGESVTLDTKPDEDKDDYGRFLRYVILDGKDIGALMLGEGYAKSLCRAFPHPKCGEYDRLEQLARSEKRGRWGVCGK